jgi:uncharacterized protein (TIGR02246 family)
MKIPLAAHRKFLSTFFLFFSALVMTALSCPLAAGAQDTDLLNAIQQQNDRYVTAFNAKDASAVAALHTENAMVIAPHYGPVTGRGEIQAGLEEELSASETVLQLQALEVTRISEDTAYEIGEYKQAFKLPNVETSHDEGNTVVRWKHGKDGVWRLHVDIWNTSLPLPAPPGS